MRCYAPRLIRLPVLRAARYTLTHLFTSAADYLAGLLNYGLLEGIPL